MGVYVGIRIFQHSVQFSQLRRQRGWLDRLSRMRKVKCSNDSSTDKRSVAGVNFMGPRRLPYKRMARFIEREAR